MNVLKKSWDALRTPYLGGEVVATLGSVQGEPALGTNPDLFKASGELRVHVVRASGGAPVVTIESLQAQVPGDASALMCVRLPVAQAARLAGLLQQAADEGLRGTDDEPAPPRL